MAEATEKVAARQTALEARDGDFYLAGKKTMLLCGAMHYFRVVPEYWRDRMLRMKAAGLNCLETYMPWNLHEEVKGVFNFEGILNIREYLQIAHELGFYVLLRPGPYICSEWEFGGLPSWLLADPDMKVRSAYQPYLDACDQYLAAGLGQVADLMYSKGGPIIAVQIENEYGSYGNDVHYKSFIKESMIKHGVTEFFFTSDNGIGINRGDVDEEQITCNFQELDHGYLMYEYVKNVKRPNWPLMAMEFWSGWFDHWGDKHNIWPVNEFRKVLTWILKRNSSVNFYMMHGGTTFGFMNGANEDLGATNQAQKEQYSPDITSYDYDAPIAENGDLTPKFHALREILQKMAPQYVAKDLPDPPDAIPSSAYGPFDVSSHALLEDILKNVNPIKSERPLTMEQLKDLNNGGGQGYGFILYRSTVGAVKRIKMKGKIKDRAVVMLNGKEVATFDWLKSDPVTTVTCEGSENCLDILIENCGRVNYADLRSPLLNDQRKGLRDDVLVDDKKIGSWDVFPLEFKPSFFEKLAGSWREGTSDQHAPCLYRATLNVDSPPTDTWLDMKEWTKGVVWVNGFNLGRYWNIGPQQTLYLPGPLLKQGHNEVVVLELHKPGRAVVSADKPVYGDTVVHKAVIPAKERAMIASLKAVTKLGKWVWKPIGRMMRD